MHLTQRQVAIGLQLFVNTGFIASIIIDASTGYPVLLTQMRIICLIATISITVAYWRGWRYAPEGIVILSVLVVALACIDGRFDPENAIAFLIPALFAVVLGHMFWVITAAIATPVLVVLLSGSTDWNNKPIFFIVYTIVIIGIALSRQVFDIAAKQAREATRRSELAQEQAEAQAAAQVEANLRQQAQLEEQQRLITLVSTLETPVITLADQVLFAPIVGHLDSQRSSTLTERLLQAAYSKHAHQVILDISGALVLDTSVAKALLETTNALRLLGCQVTISGISAEVALLFTKQGLDLAGVHIVQSPQDALAKL